jgi:hypothetical protein
MLALYSHVSIRQPLIRQHTSAAYKATFVSRFDCSACWPSCFAPILPRMLPACVSIRKHASACSSIRQLLRSLHVFMRGIGYFTRNRLLYGICCFTGSAGHCFHARNRLLYAEQAGSAGYCFYARNRVLGYTLYFTSHVFPRVARGALPACQHTSAYVSVRQGAFTCHVLPTVACRAWHACARSSTKVLAYWYKRSSHCARARDIESPPNMFHFTNTKVLALLLLLLLALLVKYLPLRAR